MFTSRAEYRLLLREDNADERLTEMGFDLGLVSREALEGLREKRRLMQAEEARLADKKLFPRPEVNQTLLALGSSELKEPVPLLKLLKRPELNLDLLYTLAGEPAPVPPTVSEQIEIKHKYEGYINRQLEAVKQLLNLEKKRLPADFDYDAVAGLSNEVRQKLKEIRPLSLGQAARISGVTPAAIAILLVHLKRGSAASRGGLPGNLRYCRLSRAPAVSGCALSPNSSDKIAPPLRYQPFCRVILDQSTLPTTRNIFSDSCSPNFKTI